MEYLSTEEQQAFEAIQKRIREGKEAKQKEAEEAARQIEKAEEELTKKLKMLEFAKAGPYGSEVDDPTLLTALRGLFKTHENLYSVLEKQHEQIAGGIKAKKWVFTQDDMKSFLSQLEEKMTAITDKSFTLCCLLPFEQHERDYQQIMISQSKKRKTDHDGHRATSQMLSCMCKIEPKCSSARCPCRKANVPCNTLCNCRGMCSQIPKIVGSSSSSSSAYRAPSVASSRGHELKNQSTISDSDDEFEPPPPPPPPPQVGPPTTDPDENPDENVLLNSPYHRQDKTIGEWQKFLDFDYKEKEDEIKEFLAALNIEVFETREKGATVLKLKGKTATGAVRNFTWGLGLAKTFVMNTVCQMFRQDSTLLIDQIGKYFIQHAPSTARGLMTCTAVAFEEAGTITVVIKDVKAFYNALRAEGCFEAAKNEALKEAEIYKAFLIKHNMVYISNEDELWFNRFMLEKLKIDDKVTLFVFSHSHSHSQPHLHFDLTFLLLLL